MESLKEWATVVTALESGKQTVLLRKGGILETASGFNVEAKKFLLFPTFEHQETHHIKPEFHKLLNEIKENKPREGHNRITSYAEVLGEAEVSDNEKVKALSEFHIWSDSYIQERRNWKPEKPLKAVFLKVYRIPKREIPLKSEYQGCKSWININEEIQNGQPVLSESEINSKLEKFMEITK
ncbi:hypothetical protein C6988_08160 [Nitrosopumilus sp. b1]|uniref:DUF1802 family protein n=1 Tax=Nitrosopumilus sp. b1 TaxID=2109907 RepID=UPI0015F41A70|nr:DUF1802 family protein [Nitrosopumilus sp. b1]KAF6242629.1 hypothetical protein C6988_08160 [Nitrosopumilus sp. b1]